MPTSSYNKTILFHGKTPQNFCILESPTITSELSNPSCGDQLSLMLTIENNIVTDVGWQGEGCAISQSAASLLGTFIQNKPIKIVQQITEDDILQMLGVSLSPNRLQCATLSYTILQNCLNAVLL